jgi:hypothetical protein
MPYSRAIQEINRPRCDFTVFRFSRATILRVSAPAVQRLAGAKPGGMGKERRAASRFPMRQGLRHCDNCRTITRLVDWATTHRRG